MKRVIAYARPVLSVVKSGPDTGSPGGILTFTIEVTNAGGIDARNVVVMDVLPVQYAYISSSPAGVLSDGSVIWNLGTVAAGGRRVVSLAVRAGGGVANNTPLVDVGMVTWQDGAGNSYGPVSSLVTTTIYTAPSPPPPPPSPPPPPPLSPLPTPPRPSVPRTTLPPGWAFPPLCTATNLRIDVDGQTQTICIDLYNGGGSGECHVALRINGVTEASTPVMLSTGSSQRICWTVHKSQPGNYLVEVAGQKAWFTVGAVGAGVGAAAGIVIGFFIAILLGLLVVIWRQRYLT